MGRWPPRSPRRTPAGAAAFRPGADAGSRRREPTSGADVGSRRPGADAGSRRREPTAGSRRPGVDGREPPAGLPARRARPPRNPRWAGGGTRPGSRGAGLLDVYGVDIQSPSEANIFRSGSGSLYVALAILFCLGASNTRYTRTSLVTLFTFMSGLAVGRLVSIVADGWPHTLLIAVLVVEASYAVAAAYALREKDSSPQPRETAA
ncbi:DUF4345 domain-containing protein [Streptomyces caniscabiei]|uniref:DUF4345 domain-containing protein n=1 Tax=Streptomyces caniscabiei TaxID=2746961 RepID=UPI0029A4563C|nr:DUF4345 domain-containing protein [Streptomyces caniscabiei]MDX3733574.1 DUF4345 domain-containing protein [Streptomyces caniscabiei]